MNDQTVRARITQEDIDSIALALKERLCEAIEPQMREDWERAACDCLQEVLDPWREEILYQVMNADGYPAGNDQHEYAIFETEDKAKEWIRYIIEDCGTGDAVDKFTIRKMQLIKESGDA